MARLIDADALTSLFREVIGFMAEEPNKDMEHIVKNVAMTIALIANAPTIEPKKGEWHDLRKDPTDLPNDERLLIIAIKHSYSEIDGYRDYTFGFYSNDVQAFVMRNHASEYYEAIAWKEIEPFEVEEDD